MVTDPIGDMLVRIVNASRVRHASVTIPLSRVKLSIAEALERNGYVRNIVAKGKKVKKIFSLDLVYAGGESKVHKIARVSKPSRRVYMRAGDIIPVRQGLGSLVLSTPKGILTGEEAKKENVGGEVLFTIW